MASSILGLESPRMEEPGACIAGDSGFSPWVGKLPWRRAWLPAFLAWRFHGWRSLVGHSPWSHTESDATERPDVFFPSLHTWWTMEPPFKVDSDHRTIPKKACVSPKPHCMKRVAPVASGKRSLSGPVQ